MSPAVRRRFLFAGFGLLLTAGAALGAYAVFARREVTTSSSEALQYYRLGREHDRNMYYKEALGAYAEALRLDPHFVMATLRLAYLTRERDPERARSLLECARSSVGSISERERLQFRILETSMNSKEPKEVEPLLDEYVRRFPDDPEGYFQRAGLYNMSGRVSQGIADLEKLIALNPNYAAAYNLLGYYWLAQGDYRKAEEYLRRYRFLAPDQANPNDSLGELYISIGRYEEAEEFLKKALEVKPDFYPSLAHLGTLEVARGHFVEAAGHYRAAGEATDRVGDRRAWLWSASLSLAIAGKADDATAVFATIPPPPPGGDAARARMLEIDSQLRRGIFAALLGRTEEARAVIAPTPALIADLPGEAKENAKQSLAAIRGFVARREGRDEEAVEAFRASIPERPDRGTVYFQERDLVRIALSQSLAALGRADEAEKALKPILSRNPKFQPALDALSRIRSGAPAARS